MYATLMQLTCSFLCSVLIMSQPSAAMAMTTTPPVTMVCSSTSSFLSNVIMAPFVKGFLTTTSSQYDVVLLLPLTPKNSGGVVGLATVLQQQPQSQMPLQAYANCAMGPPQVGFSFRVEPLTVLIFIYVWCLFWCMLFTFRCHAGCHIYLGGLNH